MRGGLTGSFLLSYLAGFALIGALVHYGGIWNVLANTRLLDPLMDGGIVALTDQDSGFVQGVPDLEYYIRSQDPVDWGLVLLAAGLFLALRLLKAYQFHALARFAGVDGSLRQHGRAYLFGYGIGRMLPFDVGSVAGASALEAQGTPLTRGMQVVFLARLFTVFEVVFFAAVGLYLTSVTDWIGELLWPLVILGCAYFLVRPGRDTRGEEGTGGFRAAARASIRALAQQPRLLVWLCLISIVVFLLADAGAFLISQAFTSDAVILDIDGGVILMGVVGGQVARLVQFTPGGLGQYEWGFAAAVYAGGVGFPEAATVALLVSFIRYVTGGLLFGAFMLSRGGGIGMREVLARFARTEPVEAA
jgi:uncharacterized membrane protein YbhN (UPF0104 family)